MATIHVSNPRTGIHDYSFNAVSSGEVAAHCSELRQAQLEWAAKPLQERCETLLEWRDAIASNRASITEALTVDTGRHMVAAIEVDSVIDRITYWSDIAPALAKAARIDSTSTMVPSVNYETLQIPYPLVGIISPWNVPLILGLIDAIPALLAGSAVIIKPSEITPRFATPLQDTIDSVPELTNVLRLVLGAAETGKALIENVDTICFTGSVATGKKVAISAAENFIPAFLELGGKDPAIVMADSDLDAATTAILRSAAGLTGQTCQSLERIYVHNSIFSEFVELLVKKAKQIKLNYPDLKSGHIGPFIFPAQGDKVQQQLDDALLHGAVIRCGGNVQTLGGGKYCEATVLTNVNHDMKIMQEETFGPLMPVMPFATIDDAVALANDSKYGLSASVFSKDVGVAKKVAIQINAGAIGINDGSMTAAVHDVEKNSFLNSGMGASRMGDVGFLRFFRSRSLLQQTTEPMSLTLMAEENRPAGS